MFYSVVFPGILQKQTEPIQAVFKDTQLRQKVVASMPVERSADHQGANTSSDETSLIRLYEQFRRPIHSYIFRLLGSQDDADDVTQEVFVRVFLSWSTLYERDNLSSWMYRIATNLCVDILRKRKRISWWPLRMRSHQDDYAGDAAVQEDYMSLLSDNGGIPEIAERELIRLALANMPEEYAIVLVLSAAQGIPYQEIAHILNISPNAAATRI